MLIIDEQILSPILMQTALTHRVPIYYSDDVRSLSLPNQSKILTNSESCLKLLEKNEPGHVHVKASKLVKDKAKFREVTASISDQFYYRRVDLEELQYLDSSRIPFPVVIKPNKGYSSVGVHIVESETDWEPSVQRLYSELLLTRGVYSDVVIDSEQIIIEEWIDGEEYALDCYFNDQGKPVILNIMKRRFASERDTSDRIYYTSVKVISEVHDEALEYMTSLNHTLGFKNYPFHMEVRRSAKGIVPIEMNPMRFAGIGTTDISHFAYGINAAEAYFLDESPHWEEITEQNDSFIYGFFCAEVPTHISRNLIAGADHEALKKEFSAILDYREIESVNDRTFAVVFFKTRDMDEIDRLLTLDLEPYLFIKELEEAVR